MLGCQPVPEAYTDPPDSFHAPHAGGQFRPQKTGVCRLVRDAANGRQPQIGRGRRVPPLFEVMLPEHNGAIEREARLGAGASATASFTVADSVIEPDRRAVQDRSNCRLAHTPSDAIQW